MPEAGRKVGGGVAADASFLETLDQTASVLDLHRSNLLRLQAEELVKECELSGVKLPKWTGQVAPYAEQLSALLQSVDLSKIDAKTAESCPWAFHTEEARLLESFSKKKKTSLKALPFTSPATASASSPFKFLLGRGSHCSLTKASGNANVLPTYALVLLMPSALWDNKDYKHHRYFDKRNLLVWHVAQALSHKKNHSKVGRVYWTFDAHDSRKPSLIVIPPAATSQTSKKRKGQNPPKKHHPPKFRIHIRFELESIEWISPLRLVPNRCNLPTTDLEAGVGSPLYNQALLEDAYHAFLPSHHHHHRQPPDSDSEEEEEEHEYPHWADAVVLAKIWCLQRGLLRAHDGFQTDHLALLILYLYRTRQANARMAPLQVLAVVFKCLAENIWFPGDNNTTKGDDSQNNNNLLRQSPSEASHFQSSEGTATTSRPRKRAVLVMPTMGRTEAQTIARSSLAKLYYQQTKESPLTPKDPTTLVELYRQDYPGPVFLDSTLRFNYWGRLSPSFLRLVQYEAVRSLHFLNNPLSSSPEQIMPVDKPFPALFMRPTRFWDRFDLYLKVPLRNFRIHATTNTAASLWSKAHQNDWGHWEALTRSILAVLDQALGDRVRSMRILSTGNGSLSKSTTHDGDMADSDQIPLHAIHKGQPKTSTLGPQDSSPTGDDSVILGVSLNVDNCARIVDRGPPAEHAETVQSFVDFWGDKAELRRFKDGSIVQAVVWNTTKNEPGMESYSRYQNEDILQGGIVERIIHYILHRHFLIGKKESADPSKLILSSPLRNMTSVIDGVATTIDEAPGPWLTNPTLAHRSVMKAFDGLATFLKEHSFPSMPIPGTLEEKTSRLGIPLPIDAVEPLSPSLRYAELFPPLPHPFLGGTATVKGLKKTPGVVSSDPILMQIRFGASSKWPTDIKAIGAAKTAMLIQLANGIEDMQSTSQHDCDGFSGLIAVTPNYLDVGYQGYVFRIQVRADPEIRLLRGLFKPSAEAAALLTSLTRDHIILAMHHSMIHAIHTKHASAGGVVRMAMRWVSGHMLSGLIPQEAIELLVAKVYSDRSSPLEAPGSVVAGFLRFLQLLESHDWIREPLIVDPHGHIDDEDRSAITTRFEQTRGPSNQGGPPMYIVSPNDRQGIEDALSEADDNKARQGGKTSSVWAPSFTSDKPEWVVLTRISALARKTRLFLASKLATFEQGGWSAAFQETSTSFHAYSGLLRIDSDLVTDSVSCSSSGTDLSPIVGSSGQMESSYTRSLRERHLGPKKLRLKIYRNMRDEEADQQVCHNWTPVESVVDHLREQFGSLALFFYNQLCPEVIAILWRPQVLSSQPFSVMGSEHAQPCVAANWKADTMVVRHIGDILREMSQYWQGVVIKTKLFQEGGTGKISQQEGEEQSRKKARKTSTSESEDED